MTPEMLSILTILSSLCVALAANYIAAHRLKSQNANDDSSAAESVSSATIALIAPLRNELVVTHKELTLTREQLQAVQKQLDETMAALRITKSDVLMFQSEIRLLTTQNAALTLRVTELEAENLRLHKQIDAR